MNGRLICIKNTINTNINCALIVIKMTFNNSLKSSKTHQIFKANYR